MKMKMGGGPRKISTSASRSVLENDRPKKKKKREVEDIEDVQEKREKKVKKALGKLEKSVSSRELTVVVDGRGDPSNLKKKEKKAIKGYFGSAAPAIMDMLEEGNNDGGITALKKSLLLTVIRVLPSAEKTMVDSESGKGTYQFVTLISQIRELVGDIEADRDRAYIAQSLLETIIRPAFMDMAQELMTKHHEFRKATEDYVKPAEAQAFSRALMSLAKDLAGGMTTTYKDVATKLVEALKT